MSKSIAETIIAILAEQAVLDVADVKLESSLVDLGLDSLGLVETVFAIEEAFDVQVPYNASAGENEQPHPFDTSTVSSIVRAVEMLVAQK